MCGHSAGAWTTLLSTFGDQDIFKAALVMDPFNSDVENICGLNSTFNSKVPTCMIYSSQWWPLNVAKFNSWGEDLAKKAFEEIKSYISEGNPCND
jgi:hypothetical protein